MGSIYTTDGIRWRKLTLEDVGTVIMGAAAFAGPAGPEVFLVGAGAYLIGATFDM